MKLARVFSCAALFCGAALLGGCGLAGSSSSNAAGPPSISTISPANGGTAGGTAVTISGNNLQSGAAVSFGGVAASSVKMVNSSQMTAVTPAHAAGSVDVTVTNPDGKSATLSSGFGYGNAPSISGVSPNSGPNTGGTTVNITGSNFATGPLVFFGTIAATGITIAGPTQIQAITPAVSTPAAVNVVVQNSDGQSGTLANGFTFTDPPPSSPPTVTDVSPNAATSGATVTVDGTNFGSGATVNVGSTAASNVQFLSSSQLNVSVPNVSPGTYDVTVANSNGLSATLSSGLTVTSPQSLLSGCTVTTAGTVGSTSNEAPAISCAVPTGWTLVSAENFAGGVLHATDKTQAVDDGINCSIAHSAGSCSMYGQYAAEGDAFRWVLDHGAIGSSSEVYVSFWEEYAGTVWDGGNFELAEFLSDGSPDQELLIDRWPDNSENRTTPSVPPYCADGVGPGYDYTCQSAQSVINPQSVSGGINAAYYGPEVTFPSGLWRQVEIHYKANTPGSSDGDAEVYVNGQLVQSISNANLNGAINMAGMEVDVWQSVEVAKFVDSSTRTVCEVPNSAGSINVAGNFTDFAPCPIPPDFSRYLDDVVVLKR
jgi:hypothetical protein